MNNADKYKGLYRIPSARWAVWDYGNNPAYFVTICIANRHHDFGEITNRDMELSLLGQCAWNCWYEIPAHFPFVKLGEFVVMPNHVHGIVVIDKTDFIETQNIASAETQNIASLQGNIPKNRFGPQSQNLASIIRGNKIGVTKFAHQNNIPFSW